MNPARKKRLSLILFLVGGIGLSAVFVLNAFDENMNLYYDPTQVMAGEAPVDHTFRLGGMVKDGSFNREKGSLMSTFDVTDYQKVVTVHYEGILPDLFREGQGIITLGKLNAEGTFIASEVQKPCIPHF